jgi:hypothetical protein
MPIIIKSVHLTTDADDLSLSYLLFVLILIICRKHSPRNTISKPLNRLYRPIGYNNHYYLFANS